MKIIKIKKILIIIIITLVIILFCLYYLKSVSQNIINYNLKEIDDKPNVINVKTVKLSFAGDCTIGYDYRYGYSTRYDKYLDDNNGDFSYYFRNVYDVFANDDLTVVNLEGTFTSSNDLVTKAFNFKAPTDYVNVLLTGSVEAVSFANNHAYDYNVSGFNETIDTLNKVNIDYYENNKYLIKEINGIKLGFFAFLDIYGEKYTESKTAIDYLKSQNCDIIIASMHWGIERDLNQASFQTKLGHYLIDNGVDLVIGHHPHRIQGIEKYNNKYIVYSLGNFSFGGNQNPPDKDTFIFQQTFTFVDNKLVLDDNINILPASVSSTTKTNNYQPTLLEGEERVRVLNKIMTYSTGFTYNLKKTLNAFF